MRTFDDILAQVLDLLQREGRASYRALRRRFDLDAEYLEDLKAEIIEAKRLAVDEGGTVLVWTGEGAPVQETARERHGGRAAPAYPIARTPAHLAEKILQSRSALEGERKQVTVLFADLKGSMELLADRDPEEARKLLDPVLERMMEAVHRFEGTVNQVMGDGIMALFGAPLAHEDHAVRACYAALRMQESVKGYAQEVQRREGIPIQMRVGLNSGEVVVRSIGSDLRMDYTAVGQTTHLAARMEQMAMPGSILMTGDALRLAEGYAQVQPLGPVPVKGLDAPVEVYEVTGAGPVRTRLQASAARGLTRFVGRDAEMEALRQAVEKAGAGRGQVAALVGEPGVGKSRLVYEFTRSHRVHGWLTLQSSSVSYGKATPYLPVIDLLKTYFQIEDRDDLRRIREKVTGKLLTLDRALEPTLPAFLSLLDVPVEDRAWQNLDPPQRRGRTLEAVKRLLLRESQEQPLLVVFEDLHWIDSETQAILDSLVESLPTARMLLLVNYRPEYQHGWGSKTCYTQLRLDPLPPESAGELLQALLGDDAGLAPLKQLLIQRTEGNPFFLEESVRTLVEQGVLVRDAVGAVGAGLKPALTPALTTRSFTDVQVPATVQAVLAARIDRLPPEEKGLLQTASVIGKDVPFTLLQPIADLPEEGLRRGLAHLQSSEFLYETSLFPDLEYTFKHALTHEVAYGSLLQERRRTLHTRIVEAIEAVYSDRLTEHAERLAHHAVRGEVWEKALPYCRQAGTKAAGRSAHREAVASFEQGLEALKHLPESREVLEQAIDLRIDLRNSLYPLGERMAILDRLREAEALAEAIGDQRRLGLVSAYTINDLSFLGDSDRSIASGQRALAISEALGDLSIRVIANQYLGILYLILGDYRRAMSFCGQNMEVLQGDLIHERFGLNVLPSVISRSILALCLAEMGMFAEGLARGEEGVRIAEAVDHPQSFITAYQGIGVLYLLKGDLPRAIPPLERGIGLCQTADIPSQFPSVASSLGYAYTLSGRVAEALPLLEQVAEQTTIMVVRSYYPFIVTRLGGAYLLCGRTEEAADLAARALDRSRQLKQRGYEAYALRLSGEIALHRDPPEVEQAEEYYRQALALAEELGMRPLAAHCRYGLGTLYRKAGRPAPARAELSAALSMYRDMEMTFYLSRAEAALKDSNE